MPVLKLPSRTITIERRLAILLAAGLLVAGIAGMTVAFGVRVSALRAHRATGPNWSFPSRVYSAGVPLVPDRVAPEPYVLSELAARGYRRVRQASSVPGTWSRAPGGELDVVLRGFPDGDDPEGSGGPERVRVRFRDGRIAAVERLGGIPGAQPPHTDHPPRIEPMLVAMVFDDERMWRSWVSLERVPPGVRDAIIASEDRRFDQHFGVDPRAFARAISVNMRAGKVRQGGSTITQQLARGLFLGRERTLFRKMGEVPLAIGLEVLLSKDQILEMYLNSVYWGQARGFAIGGVAQAARWYFDAPVESLGVLEGATLAAMIPAPNVMNPFENADAVRERRNQVLDDMVEIKRLTPARAARLKTRPLGTRRGRPPVERYPSFSGYVTNHLDRHLKRHAATHHGLSIFTTLDLAWQIHAERAIVGGLAAMESPGRSPRLQGALVALDPATSSVVAMVGGRSAEPGDFNRAWQARRQSGSAIKPIVYAAAFASPLGLTPATTIADTPRTFGTGKWSWRPRNSGNVYHDEVTLAKALEMSLNVATTNLVEQVGPNEIAAAAGRFGLGKLRPVMSIGLGSNETTLLDLTNAIAVFPAGGMLREPTPIRVVVDRSGSTVYEPAGKSVQVLTPGIAALMTGLLQNVVRYGVAAPLRWAHGLDRPIAGKTGTTNEFHDAWFVGFTPELVAGVWVGYDRPRSIGRQASRTALPLWARAVRGMLEGFPPAPFPADAQLDWVDIDPWWGCLADSLTRAERVPFLMGTGPVATCEWRRILEPPLVPDSSDIGEPWFDDGDAIAEETDEAGEYEEYREPEASRVTRRAGPSGAWRALRDTAGDSVRVRYSRSSRILPRSAESDTFRPRIR